MARTGKISLALLSILVAAFCLWREPIAGNDEARVAGISREMAIEGQYSIPRLNGKPFLEYPGLGYLPAALLFRGNESPSDPLAHLPAAIFALATIACVFRMGKLLGGERLGVVAGFAQLTMFGFTQMMNRALVDPALLFWVTASLGGFFAIDRGAPGSVANHALFFGGAAAAFLTKGLIGIAIPASVAGAYLLVKGEWKFWKVLRLGWGLLFFAIPLGAWGFCVVQAGGWESLREFLRQSIWRFSSSSTDHNKPFYFYALPILYLLLPWTFLFLFLLWQRWGKARWKEGLELHGAEIFPAVWFVVVFLGLSVSSAKRNLYLGPIFPAFALLAAIWWERVVVRYRVGARTERILLGLWLFGFAAVRIFVTLPEATKDAWRPMMETARKESSTNEFLLYRPFEATRGAAVFFLGKTVPVAETPEQLRDLLRAQAKPSVVLTLDEHLQEFRDGCDASLGAASTWKVGRYLFQLLRATPNSPK